MPRGGPQRIPRPAGARPGDPAPWAGSRVVPAVDDVIAALAGRGPARDPEVAVAGARAAAVLVPVFDEGGVARVVLTRRSSRLRTHQGEVAFPGGRQEPGEDLWHAALRETAEEIGLDPRQVEPAGELDRLVTVASRFVVAPFVGVLPGRPAVRPNPAEIERVFDVALTELLEPDCYHEEIWDLPWGERRVSFFLLEGETVWGATARILRELLVLVTGAGDPYADRHAHPQL